MNRLVPVICESLRNIWRLRSESQCVNIPPSKPVNIRLRWVLRFDLGRDMRVEQPLGGSAISKARNRWSPFGCGRGRSSCSGLSPGCAVHLPVPGAGILRAMRIPLPDGNTGALVPEVLADLTASSAVLLPCQGCCRHGSRHHRLPQGYVPRPYGQDEYEHALHPGREPYCWLSPDGDHGVAAPRPWII